MKVSAFQSMITESLTNVVHWIFAFKYWTVACKLEQLKRGANPDEYNSWYTGVFVAGVLLNLANGVLQGTNSYP